MGYVNSLTKYLVPLPLDYEIQMLRSASVHDYIFSIPHRKEYCANTHLHTSQLLILALDYLVTFYSLLVDVLGARLIISIKKSKDIQSREFIWDKTKELN